MVAVKIGSEPVFIASVFGGDRHLRPIADLRHLVKCCTAVAALLPFANQAAFLMDQCRHSGLFTILNLDF